MKRVGTHADTTSAAAVAVDVTNMPKSDDLSSSILVKQADIIGTFERGNVAESGMETRLPQTQDGRPLRSLERLLEQSYNRLMPLPPAPAGKEFFRVIQKWEGYVIEVTQDSFWARLTVLTGEEGDQNAEILISAVDEEDLPLVEPGAIFYWSIGYREDEKARVAQDSIIRFRRLPAWTGVDQMRAAVIEEKLKHLFDE